MIITLAFSSSRNNHPDFTVVTPGQNLFAHELSKRTAVGHTFDELRRLTNKIPLPYLSTAKQQHRRVPVTAVIHTKSVTQLYIQLQSVLTQTALPEHIWIICDTKQKTEAEARIMTLDRRRVTVMATDYSESESHKWLQIISQISTDFVWLVDQNIAPGKRYLENILKLSFTNQYKSALLGTEAATLNHELEDSIECIPYSMHSGSRQMKSKVVDMINDSWLLHRSWTPFLLEALEKENHLNSGTMTGLFISQVLYMNAGIPSIVLPTDPIERAYWGDIRLQKTQKSETCKAWEKLIKEGSAKTLASYNDLYYRNNKKTSTASNTITEPVIVYVDSMEELENLSQLMCQFEEKKDVDLHIVTGGTLSSSLNQQAKSYILSRCNKENGTVMDVFVHDISTLHDADNWNSFNDILHRLTRILAVTQPRILIHSLDTTHPLSKSIQLASEMAKVTIINLPTNDIPHALWMTELPIDTLSSK